MPASSGIGTGSAGTCFSGGSGSGGTYYPDPATTVTADAGGRGGAGSDSVLIGMLPGDATAAGAGNPNGNTNPSIPDDPQYNGTGGVLIIFVEGTITTADSTRKHFKANGTQGRQLFQGGMGPDSSIYPFGGGTGGGIVIVVNGGAAGLTDNIEAKGGIVTTNGPTASFRSGGDGAAVAYTFSEL
jgi:hypothetical protein